MPFNSVDEESMKPANGGLRNRNLWFSGGGLFLFAVVAVISFFFGYVCSNGYEVDFVLLKDYLGVILNYPLLAFITICVIFREQVRAFIDRSRYGSESFKQSGQSEPHRKSIFERGEEGGHPRTTGAGERVSNAINEADIAHNRESLSAIEDLGISGPEAGRLDLFLKPHTKRVLKWLADEGPLSADRVKDELAKVGLESTESVAVMTALYENGLIDYKRRDAVLGWNVTAKGTAFLKLIEVQLISFS
jgi:hypothetical protein